MYERDVVVVAEAERDPLHPCVAQVILEGGGVEIRPMTRSTRNTASLLNLKSRTVNVRRPERAQNEGSSIEDTR